MEQQFIQYGNTTIEYSLVFDDRKTLGIKVYPDKSVQVVAPFETQKDKVKEKVLSKGAWIVRQQDFFMSFHPRTPARKHISGETHLYLGKQYRLKVIQSDKQTVKLQGGNIAVSTKETKNVTQVEKQLKAWYKTKADFHFSKLFEEVQPIAKSIYQGETKLKYRWMDKRWEAAIKTEASY
jgi:predicted metal-dependent hydrolase